MPSLPKVDLAASMSNRVSSCQSCADLALLSTEINDVLGQMTIDLTAQLEALGPINAIKDLSLSNVGQVASALKTLAAYVAGPYVEYGVKLDEYESKLIVLQAEIAAKMNELGCS